MSEQSIEEAADDAKTIKVDGVEVTERSIQEKILAERHAKAQAAAKAPFGMRLARVNPGSAVRE